MLIGIGLHVCIHRSECSFVSASGLRCFLKEKLFDGSQTNTDHFVSTWHAWFFMDTVDRSRIMIGPFTFNFDRAVMLDSQR